MITYGPHMIICAGGSRSSCPPRWSFGPVVLWCCASRNHECSEDCEGIPLIRMTVSPDRGVGLRDWGIEHMCATHNHKTWSTYDRTWAIFGHIRGSYMCQGSRVGSTPPSSPTVWVSRIPTPPPSTPTVWVSRVCNSMQGCQVVIVELVLCFVCVLGKVKCVSCRVLLGSSTSHYCKVFPTAITTSRQWAATAELLSHSWNASQTQMLGISPERKIAVPTVCVQACEMAAWMR